MTTQKLELMFSTKVEKGTLATGHGIGLIEDNCHPFTCRRSTLGKKKNQKVQLAINRTQKNK